MSEQNTENNFILEGHGVSEQRNPQPDFGVDQQARVVSDAVDGQILSDLQRAGEINDQIGGTGQTVVDQIGSLREDVREAEAAFERRVDRLNSPYVLSPELEKVLKVARILKKPLILEGEPGTGKTSLAYALAGHEDLPIIHERGKSTLTAQSTLYEIDNVARLRDVYMSAEIPQNMRQEAEKWSTHLEQGGDPGDKGFRTFMRNLQTSSQFLNLDRVSNVGNYVRYGALGEAIVRAANGEKVILLFDEIDKAKREFPNDLLDELEHMTIRIRETGEEISAPKENIVVMITSNHERDLPEPFLRRCVYHYIEFPPAEQMSEIVQAHIPDINGRLLDSAIQRFYQIRGVNSLEKRPSTSEMLDWITVLRKFGVEEIGEDTPFPETLLKSKDDHDKIVGATAQREKQEKLKAAQMPESVIAALHGEIVVRLKRTDQWNGSTPDKSIEVLLANSGVPFVTESRDYTNRREFDIRTDGVRRVDILTFAFTEGSQGANLLEILDKKGLIDRVFVVSKELVEFEEIDESNDLYMKGKDVNGRTVYRTTQGEVVYETVTGIVMEGPFGGLGLKVGQVESFTNAGINSKEELLKKLKDEGEDTILAIPGIGRKALSDIKKATQRGGSASSEYDDDDEDEQYLGTSTLAKLRNNKLFDNDNE